MIKKKKKKKHRKNSNNLSSKLSKDSFAPYIHFLGFFFFSERVSFFLFFPFSLIQGSIGHVWPTCFDTTKRGYSLLSTTRIFFSFFFFPVIRSLRPVPHSGFEFFFFLFYILISSNFDDRQDLSFVQNFKIFSHPEYIYIYTLFTSLVTISISHDFFFSFFLFFFSPPPRARIHSRLNKYRFCQTSQLVHGFVPFFD